LVPNGGTLESKDAWGSKELNKGFNKDGNGVVNFEKLGWSGGNELEDELVFAEKADKRFEPNKGKEEAAVDKFGWRGGNDELFGVRLVEKGCIPRFEAKGFCCNIADKVDKPRAVAGLAAKFGCKRGNVEVEGWGNMGKVGFAVFGVGVVVGKIGKPAAFGNKEESDDKFGNVVLVDDVGKEGLGNMLIGLVFLSFDVVAVDEVVFVVLFGIGNVFVFAVNGLTAPVDSIGNCKAVNIANGLTRAGKTGATVLLALVEVLVVAIEAVVLILPALAYFFLLPVEEVEAVIFEAFVLEVDKASGDDGLADVKFMFSFFIDSNSFLVDSKSMINFDIVSVVEVDVVRFVAEFDFFNTGLESLDFEVDISGTTVLTLLTLGAFAVLEFVDIVEFDVLVVGSFIKDNKDK